MNKKKLLIRTASLIFFIFFVNFLANKFYWYSSIWYFDMIMHFLGGMFLSLGYFYLFPTPDKGIHSIFKIILAVLFIGILWEVFEIIVNSNTTQNPFDLADTLSDLVFDTLGGLLGILYIFKKIFIQTENKV